MVYLSCGEQRARTRKRGQMAVKAVLSMMPLGPTTKSRNCLPSSTSVASGAASSPLLLLAPLLPAQPGCKCACVLIFSVKHNALEMGKGRGGKRFNATGLRLNTVAVHVQSLLRLTSKAH